LNKNYRDREAYRILVENKNMYKRIATKISMFSHRDNARQKSFRDRISNIVTKKPYNKAISQTNSKARIKRLNDNEPSSKTPGPLLEYSIAIPVCDSP